MSESNYDPDDPRLTAYVLGELNDADRAALEAQSAACPRTRHALDELAGAAAVLFEALQSEPAAALTPAQRDALQQAAANTGSVPSTLRLTETAGVGPDRRGSRRLAAAATVAALSLAGLAFWPAAEYSQLGLHDDRLLGEHLQESQRSVLAFSEAPESVDMLFGTVTDSEGVVSESGRTRLDRLYKDSAGSGRDVVEHVDQNLDGLVDSSEVARHKLQFTPPTADSKLGGGNVRSQSETMLQSTLQTLNEVRSVLVAPATEPAPAPAGEQDFGARPFRLTRPADSMGLTPHVAGGLQGVPVAGTPLGVPGPPHRPEQLLRQSEAKPAAEPVTVDNYSAGHRLTFDLFDGNTDGFATRLKPDTSSRRFGRSYYAKWGLTESLVDGESWYEQRGAEVYAPIVENDFIAPQGEAALSTFSVDVDTASYSNVRRFIDGGAVPPPDAVRIEELLNYFSYELPQPDAGEPFAVEMEAAPCPWEPEHRLVRVALQGRTMEETSRPPATLVFLVDVSGSMSDDNKLPLVQQSLRLLVERLTEDDRLAIVTYASEASLRLDGVTGNRREEILAVINSLNANGSTNGEGGIRLAYDAARRHFREKGANRVILCTDGDFNVGVSDDDELVRLIEQERKSGVFLSIFGFGMGNLKDAKLEGLADKGNGHYGYIDDIREAQKVFSEELTGTLFTIAKDVKVQVEFNPAAIGAYRLVGYENRALAAEDFSNDRVDAGEIGAGHSVTALYEIAPPAEGPQAIAPIVPRLRYQLPQERVEVVGPLKTTELLTLSLRYKRPEGDESVLREFALAEPGPESRLSKDTEWAAAVAAFGLLLRNSTHRGQANWNLVTELAQGAVGDDPTGRRAEFVSLTQRAATLWRSTYGSDQPPVVGVVTGLLGGDLVEVSIGSDDGIQPGTVLHIRTTAEGDGAPVPEVLAEADVVSVEANRAWAKKRNAVTWDRIQAGLPVVVQPVTVAAPADR